MLWIVSQPSCPKNFDQRQVAAFIWWPKCLHGEWRWLEDAIWTQSYVEKTGEWVDLWWSD